MRVRGGWWWLVWWLLGIAVLGCQPPARETPTPTATAIVTAPIAAASTSVAPLAPSATPPRDPPGYYLGRRIAPTMSHEAAEWLVRPEREAEESTTRMLKELKLSPGDVACDLGAGNGYHTLEMAKAVAPKGRAIAIDIQPEMLSLLRDRAKAARIKNVETVLGEQTDPKLPAKTCDLVLFADVYHELDDPAGMLAHVRRALSDEGVVALLEFRGEDPEVPIKPEHKMTRAQIVKELEANGFALVRSFDDLPWQHLMFFAPKKP
jgi:SAM-dependent methyltransferase